MGRKKMGRESSTGKRKHWTTHKWIDWVMGQHGKGNHVEDRRRNCRNHLAAHAELSN
jgi:hypothetical protein